MVAVVWVGGLAYPALQDSLGRFYRGGIRYSF
jgi:hypothetical protein